MKAGRELDALVAEKVMGWRMLPNQPGFGFPPVVKHEATGDVPECPRYSTDIAAAWEVVDRLQGWWGFGCQWDAPDWPRAWAIFQTYGMREEVRVQASQLPHAICLAALRAVGAEVDDG